MNLCCMNGKEDGHLFGRLDLIAQTSSPALVAALPINPLLLFPETETEMCGLITAFLPFILDTEILV